MWVRFLNALGVKPEEEEADISNPADSVAQADIERRRKADEERRNNPEELEKDREAFQHLAAATRDLKKLEKELRDLLRASTGNESTRKVHAEAENREAEREEIAKGYELAAEQVAEEIKVATLKQRISKFKQRKDAQLGDETYTSEDSENSSSEEDGSSDSDTNTTRPSKRYFQKLEKIWVRNANKSEDSLSDQTLAVLSHYTKTGKVSRLLAGNWGRTKTNLEAVKLVKKHPWDKQTGNKKLPEQLLARVERKTKKRNPKGKLSLTLQFIQKKIETERDELYSGINPYKKKKGS